MSTLQIHITQDFIDQRDKRGEKYNPRGRSKEQLLRDIECEAFEWHMIKTKKWANYDGWQVDGGCPIYGNVDVKCIKEWYNIPCKKFVYLLQQRNYIDHFLFVEWNERPDRLLVAGDNVSMNVLGAIEYWDVINNIQVSKYNGFYLRARDLIKKGLENGEQEEKRKTETSKRLSKSGKVSKD